MSGLTELNLMRSMKKVIVILIILVSYSCSEKKEFCFKGKEDKNYEFLESIKQNDNESFIERIVDIRQFGSLVVNKSELLWLRKPKNMMVLYGTIKSIGLDKFISEEEFQKPLFTDHWAETEWKNKSLMQIVDLLVQEYEFTDTKENYFTKFWNRRKVENNQDEVYNILRDIRDYYKGKSNTDNYIINDTLKSLLWFETKRINREYTDINEFTKEYADILLEYKLFASAYNIIRIQEGDIQNTENWFKELIKKIATDSTECENYWKWRETAIWNSDFNYKY